MTNVHNPCPNAGIKTKAPLVSIFSENHNNISNTGKQQRQQIVCLILTFSFLPCYTIRSNVCNSKPQCMELASIIREQFPDAEVVCHTGRRGSFEVQINGSLVHSKLGSLAFPRYEDVVQNVRNARDGLPLNKVSEQPITDCVVQ
ncbi:migration and invasion enhancer 1 [Anopheles maculipalpis]|uniref:migration and invasion enhancer 1 n=1 Tax=Anopheles maculipalpis TaxID=1496333 RepID=UPI0021591CC3|nr:migration and invasion enhancer 1 [Anopheles maculipalpis]